MLHCVVKTQVNTGCSGMNGNRLWTLGSIYDHCLQDNYRWPHLVQYISISVFIIQWNTWTSCGQPFWIKGPHCCTDCKNALYIIPLFILSGKLKIVEKILACKRVTSKTIVGTKTYTFRYAYCKAHPAKSEPPPKKWEIGAIGIWCE